MRILHVIPSVAARYGGPSQAVVDMAKVSLAQNHDVLIATTDADGSHRLNVPVGAPTGWSDVRAIFFRRQWSEAFKYSRPLARWLRQHVADFDVVHIHAVFSHSCVAAGRACRRAGTPYVVRPLGTLDPWSLGQKPLRKKLMWAFAGKRLLLEAAAVQYTSERERRRSEAALGLSGGQVVPLGVSFASDVALEPEAAVTESKTVLYLGRLHPKKNIDVLIDAFVQATNANPELAGHRLVIAGGGEGTYPRYLQQQASKAAHLDITFPGWLTGPAKTHALRNATLFALLSSQENFGLAAVEAMRCGVPIIVSNQVDLADEVSRWRAGWVCEPSAERIAAALAAALGDERDRRLRGERARELAAQYSWSNVGGLLSALYQSVSQMSA